MAESQTTSGQPAGLATDLAESWRKLPNKAFFFSLLAAWVLLFQFLGNATFGYINTQSLFGWMLNAYRDNTDANGDGHGVLIPFVVLALMIWKREKLLAVNYRMWWPALILLAAGVFLHLLGYLIQQPRLSIVAFFCGVYALMGLAWGPAFLRACMFPFFLFAFSVPITSIGGPVDSLTFNLRMLVTKMVTLICNGILGLDVLREGTQLYNAGHTFTFEVAAACSGLRSLISIFAICTIYGFIAFDKTWQRVLLMGSAAPLAIFGNMLRMLTIIVAASMEGQDTGNRVHDSWLFGMLPYVPAFLGIVLMEQWLRKSPRIGPTGLDPKIA